MTAAAPVLDLLPRDVLNIVFSFFSPEELLAVRLMSSIRKLPSVACAVHDLGYTNLADLSKCFRVNGSLDFLHWLHITMRIPLPVLFKAAAECARFDLMEAAIVPQPDWSYPETGLAIGRGGLAVIKWAEVRGCPLNGQMLLGAAERANVEAVKWLRERDVRWDAKSFRFGGRGGDLWILNDIAKEHMVSKLLIMSEDAAQAGHLQVLEWMVTQRWTMHYHRIIEAAAARGRIAVVEWALRQGGEKTLSATAEGGSHSLATLKWLRERGFPWNELLCRRAAEQGRLESLQYARTSGCEWNDRTTQVAAARGHLQVLQWAMENGCPAQLNSLMNAAARFGRMDVLEYLSTKWKVAPTPQAAISAATGGKVQVLVWLRAKGVDVLQKQPALSAARRGARTALSWLLDQGVNMREDMMVAAAEGGNNLTLEMLLKRGLPLSSEVLSAAIGAQTEKTVAWLLSQNCPIGSCRPQGHGPIAQMVLRAAKAEAKAAAERPVHQMP